MFNWSFELAIFPLPYLKVYWSIQIFIIAETQSFFTN